MIVQLLLGALACVVFVLAARPAGLRRELVIYSAALVLAAFIYVVFAAVGGAPFGWVTIEVLGLALFSAAALLASKGYGWALVAGWAIHPAWDVLLHGLLRVGFVPGWYPVVCAGFDLFLAGYIAVRLRK